MVFSFFLWIGNTLASFQVSGNQVHYKDILINLFKDLEIAEPASRNILGLTPSGPVALLVSSDLRISSTSCSVASILHKVLLLRIGTCGGNGTLVLSSVALLRKKLLNDSAFSKLL